MEPERKVEKWLKAFAKKRRADGGAFELHPATRRMLQAEVARLRPVQPKESRGLLFGVLRPAYLYLAAFAVLVFMAASLLLPALSNAKLRSQQVRSLANLKQLGEAAKRFAADNGNRLPVSLSEIQLLAGSNALIDPYTGKSFVYVGGGRTVDTLQADSLLAYSPEGAPSRAVLFADGHVESVDAATFSDLRNRGLTQLAMADKSVAEGVPAALAAAPMVAQNANDLAAASAYGAKTLANRDELKKEELETHARRIAANEPRREIAAPASKQAAADFGQKNAASAGAYASPAGAAPLAAAGPAAAKLDLIPAAARSGESDSRRAAVLGDAAFGGKASMAAAPAAAIESYRNPSQAGQQQIFKNSAASPTPLNVLSNFQLEQNGAAISVVDGDGSIYKGFLVADPLAGQSKSVGREAIASKSVLKQPLAGDALQQIGAPQQSAQNYYFRVTGLNRSLRQNVVFTGNFVTFSNNPTTAQQAIQTPTGVGAGGTIAPPVQTNVTEQLLLSNLRIAGTALINETNSVKVDAVPVPQ